MKSIAVFNNKGGVGKTTLLANIASFLKIRKHERVLLVDADPQCNASIYTMPISFIEETYSKKNPDTIYNIVKPVKRAEGFLSWDKMPIVHSEGFGVDVILGDTRMSNAEDFLSKDWVDCINGEARAFKSTLMFKQLMMQAEGHYDYVFFDVGPSLGAINRIVLIACDYFLIPMSSDVFSLKAVENISIALKGWKEDFRLGMSRFRDKEHEEYQLDGVSVDFNVRFIGYVTQQYVSKTVAGTRRPVHAYDTILRNVGTLISKSLHEFYDISIEECLKLGEIPNFNSLIPLSQIHNKSIFRLESQDGIVGAHFAKVKEYESVIASIVDNLIENEARYDKLA